MIRLLTLLAGLVLLTGGAQTARPLTPSPIAYLMAPQIGDDGLASIAVTVNLAGDSDGVTAIELPDRWAGNDRLYDFIADLGVKGGKLVTGADAAHRTITHRPGAPLTIRYQVVSAAEADPGIDYEKAHPVIRPGWFDVHGEGAMTGIADRNDAPAIFRWAAAPPGWTFASDLDAAGAAADAIRYCK